MRIPKSLLSLAAKVNGTVELLRYHAHGQVNNGFAIVDADSNELLEIEPVYYSNGDRWLIRNKCTIPSNSFYRKSLRGFTTDIKAGRTGYVFTRG
jgi:hypothetical protein